MNKCELCKNEIQHLGHLIPGQRISPMKQNVKTITDLAPMTNMPEARHDRFDRLL